MRLSYRTLFKTPSGLEYLHLQGGGKDILSVQGAVSAEGRIRRVYACGMRLLQASPDSSLNPVACVGNADGFNAVFEGVLGGPLREFLRHAPASLQYAQGKRTGRLLRAFHSGPLSVRQRKKASDRQSKLLERLALYISSMPHFNGDEAAVKLISSRFGHYDCNRPCMRFGQLRHDRIYVKGDLSIVFLPSSTLGPGDASEDFALMECMSAGIFPIFCAGVVDGYFQGEIPADFFSDLALQSALYALWKCGKYASASPKAFKLMQREFDRIAADFSLFKESIPLWYVAGATQKARQEALRSGL